MLANGYGFSAFVVVVAVPSSNAALNSGDIPLMGGAWLEHATSCL